MKFIQGPRAVCEQASLWRYVPLHTFLHYLHGNVFIPTIEKLQQGDIREGREQFDYVTAAHGFTTTEYNKLYEWVREKRLSDALRKNLDNNQNYLGANRVEVLKEFYRFQRRSRFAWCWFRSEHESAAMWAFYGNKGVAIRSSIARLKRALEPCNQDWLVSELKYVSLQDLDWESFIATDDGREWIRRPFLLKGLEYAYENEVRLVTVAGERERKGGFGLEGMLPGELIEEVRFWPDIPEACIESIRALVRLKHPGVAAKLRSSRIRESSPDSLPVESSGAELMREMEGPVCDEAIESYPNFLREP